MPACPATDRDVCAATLTILYLLIAAVSVAAETQWSQLPSIPDREGFAGMFAGVSGDVLLVAGGANFPSLRPWEGGTKVWYREVWALKHRDGEWTKVGKLEEPLGYGVTVTWHDTIVCIGGSNSKGHTARVTALRWKSDKIQAQPLPSLPEPCANMCGALLGDTVFVAGGIDKPDAIEALHTFWSLDLAQPSPTWQRLDPWPGKERMLAVAAAYEGYFYLFSGAALHRGNDGKPERDWMRDAFRYTPERGWERLPDLPRPAVAAPSPAPAVADGLLVIGGDDGKNAGFRPEAEHPGFPRSVWLFDPAANAWRSVGEAPFSRATVPVVAWGNGFVIPSGEVRPGYRSNEVWLLQRE